MSEHGLEHGVSERDAAARDALSRLLAEPLARSPALAAFLRFVVERALAGRGAEIKAYTIATEALGRPASFDPALDPIVRVQGARLRRLLDAYYEAAGRDEPLRVLLDPGSYVPRFVAPEGRADARGTPAEERADGGPPAAPLAATPEQRPAPRRPRHRVIAALAALGMLGLLMMGLLVLGRLTGAVPPARRAAAEGWPPVVAVKPLAVEGRRVAGALSALSLGGRLRMALSHFDDLVVVLDGDGAAPGGGAAPAPDYQLHGGVIGGPEGEALVALHLVDAATGGILWAREFRVLDEPRAAAAFADAILRETASQTAETYGVIFAQRRAAVAAGAPRRPYACVLASYESWRSLADDDRAAVRACLEGTVARDPGYAPARAHLAMALLRDHRDAPGPPDPALRERALEEAKRAVALAPSSAVPEIALSAAHAARGEASLAIAAGRAAVALNPASTTARAALGARLVQAGASEEGELRLREADGFAGGRTEWHDAYLFLAAWSRGDPHAPRAAALLTEDDHALGLVARALAADQRGDAGAARAARALLAARHPALAADPAGVLARYGFVAPFAERVAAALGPASPAPPAASAP